jgi:iduronate 2-sulfatase
MVTVLLLVLLLLPAAYDAVAAAAAPKKPNVLYLMADDMRPNIKAYGVEFMHTPHLDALAAKGLLFSFAYTQYSVCAPSRNSFLSGRRPDTTKCWSFKNHFRQVGPEWTAMPQYFKNAGYFTAASGKIYHAKLPPNFDGNKSWTVVEQDVLPWHICPGNATDANGGPDNPNYCNPSDPDPAEPFDEEVILARGIQLLDQAHASGQPWWVGIGTHRPHWPWRAPPQFLVSVPLPAVLRPVFDWHLRVRHVCSSPELEGGHAACACVWQALYPPAAETPIAADPHPPAGVPPMACNFHGNMRDKGWEQCGPNCTT